MKIAAIILAILGVLLLLYSIASQRHAARRLEQWRRTLDHVDSFGRTVSIEELKGGSPVEIDLKVPSDERWKRALRYSHSLKIFITCPTKKALHDSLRFPKDPLSPAKVELMVNGLAVTPEVDNAYLTQSWVHHWGVGAPVSLGDSIKVRVSCPEGYPQPEHVTVAWDWKKETPEFGKALNDLFFQVYVAAAVVMLVAAAALWFLSTRSRGAEAASPVG